jgi:hypothetical protein
MTDINIQNAEIHLHEEPQVTIRSQGELIHTFVVLPGQEPFTINFPDGSMIPTWVDDDNELAVGSYEIRKVL